ncbi:Crp/Fnr family transcriptional regulator [Arthrospiribacter ruber]|nr:Crp/Fnr family transcriptional regulator [Arthrospiribacter ruber]
MDLIEAQISRKSIKKGDVLLGEGEICQNIFFVESGLLRLFSIDASGKEHIIQFAPENWLISERSSLYFGLPSSYYIDALEDSELVIFDLNFIQTVSSISPEFRVHNEYILQNHIRQLQNRINLLIGANAEERYLDFIKLYPDLTLRIPQWMIASYLGITPESLSRVRKQLAHKNFR